MGIFQKNVKKAHKTKFQERIEILEGHLVSDSYQGRLLTDILASVIFADQPCSLFAVSRLDYQSQDMVSLLLTIKVVPGYEFDTVRSLVFRARRSQKRRALER